MPEANTIDLAKKELIDSFIKYITGVYLLQQEFVDDMQGGLQSILEKYTVLPIGTQSTVSESNEQEPEAAPKKTRKRASKKDVKPETVEPVEEAVEPVEPVEPVEEAVEPVEPVEEAVEPVEPVEGVEKVDKVDAVDAVDTVDAVEEETTAVPDETNDTQEIIIPSHVEITLNEKKQRKPRAKKEAAVAEDEKPKKKRATNSFRVFVSEYSKLPKYKNMTAKERNPLLSDEWAIIQEQDPEKFKIYEQKADELNRKNGLL